MADIKDKEGHWVTLENGTHVFIGKGETLDDAIAKLKNNPEKPKEKKEPIDWRKHENKDWDEIEKNNKKNSANAKSKDRKDKYGNPLVSDDVFKVGYEAGKAYLDEITKYYKLDSLKKSNVFLDGLQNIVENAIINNGYDPDFDITYQDLNEIIGSLIDEEIDLEKYDSYTGKKYSGYKPNFEEKEIPEKKYTLIGKKKDGSWFDTTSAIVYADDEEEARYRYQKNQGNGYEILGARETTDEDYKKGINELKRSQEDKESYKLRKEARKRDKELEERTQGRVNGYVKDFDPEDLVDKAIERGSLYTNRRDNDTKENEYSIYVDPSYDGTFWVDIIKESYNTDYDADDFRHYQKIQDRVHNKKYNSREEVIKALEDWKKTII